MSSDVVESREQPEVRITTASGSITVVAEPRDDVVADDSVDVRRAQDGSIQVDHVDGGAAVRDVSGSVTVEAGGAGPVEVETMSGSVTVVLPASCQRRVKARSLSSRPRIECSQGNDCDVTVRTLSGGITVKC